MARVIENQIHKFGRSQGTEAQRADLWVVDFTQALSGLASVIIDSNVFGSNLSLPFVPPKLASYYANSIGLPELRVRGEMVRRDSKPYQMPTWDDPCEAIRMSFYLDCFKTGQNFDPFVSDIYQMLDVWRAVVRAGRGGMSSEFAITLDGNYRIDYAYDVLLSMLRPDTPVVNTDGSALSAADAVMNDLQYSLQLKLINCWLSSFRVEEVNYDASRLLHIEAMFYCEDIKQKSSNS